MATGNDENPNNGPQNPFAYVLIPVIGFGLVVSLITCYRFRRRKQRLARFAAAAAGAGDPEAGHASRLHSRGPNGVVILTTPGGGGGGRRNGGRSRRLGMGIGVGSREEGLNELGEAPPAYAPNGPKPPGEAGGGDMELTTYSQATAEVGMSRSPPEYGAEPPAGGMTGAGTGTGTTRNEVDGASVSEVTEGDATRSTITTSPPTDTMTTTTPSVTTNATSAMAEPTPPPRAVLPSP
ncbi:hypothetical protein GGS24DRAFT_405053 [Hypoxylon argillaceum]|nr:hypothetical protein GGS24DRAFT_405053 [Hypoxylon argillaceum]